MIELREIPLSELKKVDGYYSHPLIEEKIFYLTKIDGRWSAGIFTKQWYGWNFNTVYSAGCQLSYGHHPMEEGWEELYMIVDKGAYISYM